MRGLRVTKGWQAYFLLDRIVRRGIFEDTRHFWDFTEARGERP